MSSNLTALNEEGHSRQSVTIEIVENEQTEQDREQPGIDLLLAPLDLSTHLSDQPFMNNFIFGFW
jgi:hypothetical protein